MIILGIFHKLFELLKKKSHETIFHEKSLKPATKKKSIKGGNEYLEQIANKSVL